MDRILQSEIRQHKRRPRINKHLTERKRRARINDSLLQLKSIVYPAFNDKFSQTSKVEKADILEMTLLYLRRLQGQTYPKSSPDQFHAGFTKCFREVSQFLLSCDSVDTVTRVQLLSHLADFCNRKIPSNAAVPPQPESKILSPKRTASSPNSKPEASFPHGVSPPGTVAPLRELNCDQRRNSTIAQQCPSVIQEPHLPLSEMTMLTPPPSPVTRQHPVTRGYDMSRCYDRHVPSYTKGVSMWRPWQR